eukprot:112675_1
MFKLLSNSKQIGNRYVLKIPHLLTNKCSYCVDSEFHSVVSEYYGKTLQKSSDLKTTACQSDISSEIIKNCLNLIPNEIISKFYGCGTPIPFGINGLNILDLGSGSGRDCYIASKLVGEYGNVIGIDMTDEQLNISQKYINDYCINTLKYKKPNLKFIKGYIELLNNYIKKESMDIIISNCVINLSPRKDKVMMEIFNILVEGGEFYFSDMYCDRRLSNELRTDNVLLGEGLANSFYIQDFYTLCKYIGFNDPRVLSIREINIFDENIKKRIGNAKFYSITYRLFKCNGIEDKSEDYGQYAIYKGNINEYPNYYDLDKDYRFISNKPRLICANTAKMIHNSWLSKYFYVFGQNNVHYGLFKL